MLFSARSRQGSTGCLPLMRAAPIENPFRPKGYPSARNKLPPIRPERRELARRPGRFP